MKKIFLVISILTFLLSCKTKDSDSVSTDSTVNGTSDSKSPCELLTEKEIQLTLAFPENSSPEINDAMRTYPTCFYKWETITYSSEIDVSGTIINIENPSELTIVLVNDATESMYHTSIKVYGDAEKITDVGEMATWGNRLSQISFLKNGYLIHLHLKVSDNTADNKGKAIKLAKLVVANL